jgi:hypothetical protein
MLGLHGFSNSVPKLQAAHCLCVLDLVEDLEKETNNLSIKNVDRSGEIIKFIVERDCSTSCNILSKLGDFYLSICGGCRFTPG